MFNKRNHIGKFKTSTKKTSRPKVQAERDPARTSLPQTVAAREPIPTTIAHLEDKKNVISHEDKEKEFQEMDLNELIEKENKEDEILKLNHLPVPKSDKHAQIRRMVAERLKAKKDNEPIDLEPLYFNYNDDEFAVVDMEPFLVAVEYALQGKIILIEGHTDNKGQDKYNVDLSLKRVQKIRTLMHDMGVSDDQISVLGYGEEVAKFDNTSEVEKKKNRRVDFKVF
jgi:outer membrane protein OmpA-like peptidoglycan-associated protein